MGFNSGFKGLMDLASPAVSRTTVYANGLIKCGVPQQMFIKLSIIKFHETLSTESWVDACGRMDRHDESNGHFLKLMQMHLKMWLFIA